MAPRASMPISHVSLETCDIGDETLGIGGAAPSRECGCALWQTVYARVAGQRAGKT